MTSATSEPLSPEALLFALRTGLPIMFRASYSTEWILLSPSARAVVLGWFTSVPHPILREYEFRIASIDEL